MLSKKTLPLNAKSDCHLFPCASVPLCEVYSSMPPSVREFSGKALASLLPYSPVPLFPYSPVFFILL